MRFLCVGIAIVGAQVAFGQTKRVEHFDIYRHTSVQVNNDEADMILKGAEVLLRTDDGHADVACDVEFKRKGSVAVFSTGNGIVNSAPQLASVFRVAGNVMYVRELNFCAGKYDTETIGCAHQPGARMVLERLVEDLELEPFLLAHEHGHNVNNPHRYFLDDRYVMNSSVSTRSVRINNDEKKRYENGRLNRSGPGTRRARQIQAPATKAEVQSFVQQRFVTGIPWEVAGKISPDHGAMLVAMLNDREFEKSWGNVAVVLGLIGKRDEAVALKKFAVKEAKSISSAEYRARRNAVAYLGAIVNRTEDQESLAFLMNVAEDKRGALESFRWTTKNEAKNAQAERDEQVRIAAIWGLAYSGSDAANLSLQRITAGRKGPYSDVARSASLALTKIKQNGLLKYGADKR